MKYVVHFLLFCSLCFFGVLAYALFLPKDAPLTGSILSPLPEILNRKTYQVASSNEFWTPRVDQMTDIGLAKPVTTAASAISYDLTTNALIYEKDIKHKLPIASLTKIMTAIVALENDELQRTLTVNKLAAGVGEDSMGLSENEKLTLEELLYGLFLHSGNDAAEVIAGDSHFGRENFIHLMNKKAEDLGLGNTHFTNPTGLEGDGNQYSTAQDLLVMTRYGLLNPDFARIASAATYEIEYTADHKAYDLYNETNLLTTYPGVKGVKTGYTDEAGMCLVTYLEYGGHRIVSVLLNSQNRRQEMKDLLDYSLKTLGVKPPPHS